MVNFFNAVVKGDKVPAFLSDGDGYIDVRDTAAAHVLAGEIEAAGGERIIVRGGTYLPTSISLATDAVPIMSPYRAFLLARAQCVMIDYLATMNSHHLICL